MILHKYTSFSPYFDRVITHQELFFNRPSLFNDPFDCNYILDTTSSAIEKKDYITRTMQAQGEFTPQDINDAITKALLQELDTMYNGQATQSFISSHVQNWTTNPFIKGAYSYSKIGIGDARKIACQSINKKVYFDI